MTAPAMHTPDMKVGAAEIARFLYDSDEFRFQRRVFDLCTPPRCPLPDFRLGSRIATRPFTLLDWIALQGGFAHAE